jgi:hypothetical protein
LLLLLWNLLMFTNGFDSVWIFTWILSLWESWNTLPHRLHFWALSLRWIS